MEDLLSGLGVLSTVVVPMVLAGWLLDRPADRPLRLPPDPHEKIPCKEEG